MTGILTDSETGDLLINDGHLTLGDITGQAVEHVIVANKGEYKEFPQIGGEIDKMRNGNPDPFWRGNIINMLKSCLVAVKKIDIINGNINIEW
jgi:hypothetical protein